MAVGKESIKRAVNANNAAKPEEKPKQSSRDENVKEEPVKPVKKAPAKRKPAAAKKPAAAPEPEKDNKRPEIVSRIQSGLPVHLL